MIKDELTKMELTEKPAGLTCGYPIHHKTTPKVIKDNQTEVVFDDGKGTKIVRYTGTPPNHHPKVINLKMSAEQCANLVRSVLLCASGKVDHFGLSWNNTVMNVALLETPTTQIVQES
jgi:hypothetical protein